VTIFGKLIISSLGVLLSGQSLSKAIHCGCSLAQIGEFAFIIASLGMGLGVIEGKVYPIVVAVSILTTLTTPFFIKSADKIYGALTRILPKKLIDKLERYTGEDTATREQDSDWGRFLRRFVSELVKPYAATQKLTYKYSGKC
jgi:CPA2 family monovalent cation:H+ antiporter-2